MGQEKKKRGENWSNEEKELLRQLIDQSKDIIENKSNKTATNVLKIKEWKKIAIKFNDITSKRRSFEEMKLAWKRMKVADKANSQTGPKTIDWTTALSDYKSKINGSKAVPEDVQVMSIAPYDFLEIKKFESDSTDSETDNETREFSDDNDLDPKDSSNLNDSNVDSTYRRKKRENSLKSNEDVLQKIAEINTNFKERRLEMMEVEHKYNVQISELQIKKLKLEIALLESKKNECEKNSGES